MAAATARVPVVEIPWGDDKIERPLAAVATTYYPGQMMCLDNSGNAVSAADTGGLKFDGLLEETVRVQMNSGDAAGSRAVKVGRPFRFAIAIAAAAAGDEGKPVYVADNQTVAYAAGSTNFVLAGWVEQVLSATVVLIRPVWSDVSALAFPEVLTIAAVTASGAVAPRSPQTYVITKAGVAAMTLAAPTATTDDGIVVNLLSSTAFAHTLTATGLLQTGSASVNVATFAAQAGAGVSLMAFNGKWIVLSAVGITFS
jgi:hypothetical protein